MKQTWPSDKESAINCIKQKHGVEDFLPWFDENYHDMELSGEDVKKIFDVWVLERQKERLKGPREF